MTGPAARRLVVLALILASLSTARAGSALRRPGPFALREPAVHRVNNWVLDQVLDESGRPRSMRAAQMRAAPLSESGEPR